MTPLQVTRIAGFGKKPPQSFSQSPVILGTGAGCSVRFDAAWDKGVAAQHVKVEWNNNYWSLTDMGSPSGTWINGRKLTQAFPVTEPVELELGKGGPRCRIEPLGAPAGQPAAAPAYASAPAQPAPVAQLRPPSSGPSVPVLAAIGGVVLLLVAAAAWFVLDAKKSPPLDMASDKPKVTLPPGVDEHPVNPPAPTPTPTPTPNPAPAPAPTPGPQDNPPHPFQPGNLQDDPGESPNVPRGKMGAKALTPEERAWANQYFHPAGGVSLNATGLARMKSNSSYAVETPAAVIGQEVVDRKKSSSTTFSNENEDDDDITPQKLPVAVDNSTKPTFPGVGDQERLGSCASFSSVYYAASNNIAAARGMSTPVPLSPIWTYSMVNEGEDNGSSIEAVYLMLQEHGAPPLSMLPYPPGAAQDDHPPQVYRQWYTDPAIWRAALQYRIGRTGQFDRLDTPVGLHRLKAYLANGYLANYSTQMADEHHTPHVGWISNWGVAQSSPELGPEGNAAAGEPVLCCVSACNDGHAMTIVGYNDDVWIDYNGDGKVQPEEKGALKIVNSWGEHTWPRKKDIGFAWISYDALRDHSRFPWIEEPNRVPALNNKSAYYMLPEPKADEPYIAQFTVSNSHRDDISVVLGRSDATSVAPSITWQPAALAVPAYDANSRITAHSADGGPHDFNGGAGEVKGTFAFPLDFLDGMFNAPSEDTKPLNDKQTITTCRYYLVVTDLKPGNATTISDFQITHYDGTPLKSFHIFSIDGKDAPDGLTNPIQIDNGTVTIGAEIKLVGEK